MSAAPYDKTYYETFDKIALELDPVINLLMDLVAPSSVIDVGCGVGNWLAAFQRKGVTSVQGIDGSYISPAWLKIPPENFRAMDLNQPRPLDEQHDLVISVEVAEHLQPANAEGFIRFLTSLGPVVLFSAAVPYQGGTQHLNEQWPSYWAALFMERGYVPVDCIRSQIWDLPQVPYYYRQNVLLFVNKAELEQRPKLKTAHMNTHYAQLDLVHPVMLENIYFKRALKLLGQSYGNAVRKRRKRMSPAQTNKTP